jgi:molybdenum cofactor guanylyltransferase
MITAIILAGGKASRMKGRDKAFLKIGDEPLIKKQLRTLRELFKRIVIVTNSPAKYKRLKLPKGTRLIRDVIPDKGPLGGIYSGLAGSGSFYNFVVACDMPFINAALIRYMQSCIKKDIDIVVPFINGRPQPLFAFYSRSCIPFIEARLNQNRLRVMDLFKDLRIKIIAYKNGQKFDSPNRMCYNINTKEDLQKLWTICRNTI